MKLNTQNFELYGGMRNIELAQERGDPLADLTDDQAERLLAMDIEQRPAAWRVMQHDVVLPSPDAPVPVGVAIESAEQWEAEMAAVEAQLAEVEARPHD